MSGVIRDLFPALHWSRRRFLKGRNEPSVACPGIYADLGILMPISSQLPVSLGEKWQVWLRARARGSFPPFLLGLPGRGSDGCGAEGESLI